VQDNEGDVRPQAGHNSAVRTIDDEAEMPALNLPFLEELKALRREVHAHPELAFQEKRTSDLVARELERYGLDVHRGLAGTGVVGVLRGGHSGRMIGLRADMDALPLQENNEFAHRSQHPGLMHACGHDGHTAMLLGAARFLAEMPGLEGSVAFIFQPAEESEGGAAVMIRDGLFDRFPVDSIYGLHNWPGLPVGQMAVMSGPIMAGTCSFEIRVRGRGCHAAMPHQGSDAILAASQLVEALNHIVSRALDPADAAVVSVTQFHAGEAWNILPEEAMLRGTMRCFRPEVQNLLEQAMNRVCQGIAVASGTEISARISQRYPPTVNDEKASDVCRQAACRVLGAEQVRGDLPPSMGAEDFAYMLQKKPGCYVWLGNGKAGGEGESGGALHHPRYDFNDDILALGVSYWVELARRLLAPEGAATPRCNGSAGKNVLE